MSEHTTTTGPPPERLHWIQVKLAFGPEGRQPARPATMLEADGTRVRVRFLDATEETIEMVEPDRLEQILAADDVCRLHGRPLVLINTAYRVLGVATGPTTPPAQLKVSAVYEIEIDSVTQVLPTEDGQPTLHTLAIRPQRTPDATVDGPG